MSRLIDENDLLKIIADIEARHGDSITVLELNIIAEIQMAIDNTPTAYDVDKVIEQLEKEKQDVALLFQHEYGVDYEYADGIEINRAIDIVRKGRLDG